MTTATKEKIVEAIWSISGQIIEGQELQGHDVRVTVLQGGKSINGYYYDAAALQEVARLIEGARAYADHGRTAADQATRSVRDLVGYYTGASYLPPSGGDNPLGRVDATLHVMAAAEWLWSLISEAVANGRPDLVGLSIDIFGNWTANEQLKAKAVTKVLSLNSCDVVTRASAGGSFQRILHSEGEPNSMPDTQVQNPPETTPPAPPEKIQEQTDQITEQARLLEAQRLALNTMMEDMRKEKCALILDRRLLESGFPLPVQKQIRAGFAGRIFEETELETSLGSMRSMMAELASAGLVRDNGYAKVEPGSVITEAEKIAAAFDRMFDLEIDTAKLGNIRGFDSIREAYTRVTGDAAVAGFSERSTLGSIQISENAPIVRIQEADTTTASFSFLLGTSMNKRLLKDYQAWPAEWQKFCTITPIKDFKQQTRVRLGAFGSLSTVAEDTAYTTISLTDSAATYVPTKRGNLVTVSRETIINDDLFAIKQIPTKLAVAAAYTMAEFVYAFLSSNANIFDGNALFTSGGAHNNLGSSALSSASMQTGVTAMREQTNFAGKRLGLKPSYLIVPPELEFVAMVVTKSAGVPGSVNNDINPMLGYVVPIVSPQLSNTSQWYFAADPKIIDTIEIGFVGGQVNPALFIQDQPLFGLNFTQDVISYKIRHEYGGAVVDFRGLYRGI